MEENYSVEEIMKQFAPEEKEEMEQIPVVPYVERIENLSHEESLVEERDSMWDSVRRFLERSKKRKWGYGSEDL